MRPKQVYILPNLLTSVNILSGMFCIVFSSSGDYEKMWYAAAVLFIGMVADVFDGIIARLQRSTSEFGVQYDSLADVISFGVAPAVLAYHLSLSKLPGRIGAAIAFLYTVCAALRLARYNTQATVGEKKSFAGLPSPVAAGLIASGVAVMIHMTRDYGLEVIDRLTWPFAILVAVLGLLMISTVRYPSSKDLLTVGRKPFVYLTVGTLAIAAAILFIQEATLVGFAIYVLYGIFRGIYRIFYPVPELGTEVPRRRRRIFRRRKPGKLLGRFRKNRRRHSDERDAR